MTRVPPQPLRPTVHTPPTGAPRRVTRDVLVSPDAPPVCQPFVDQVAVGPRESFEPRHAGARDLADVKTPHGRALDLRSGRVNPPPRMPSWFPPAFDLDAAAQGARDILLAQGVSPSAFEHKAEHLVLSDADFTLLETTTPIYLVSRSHGERLMDPATGRPVELRETPGKNLTVLLRELQERLPVVDLSAFTCDFTALGSAAELLNQTPIAAAMDVIRQGNQDPLSREYVVTARSSAEVVPGLKRALGNHGARLDGVLTVNNVEQARMLGIPDSVPTEGKKALAMAALLKLNGPSGASVRSVKFMDDSDANLVAAMTVLPRLFPDVEFEFVDVVHKGGGQFELDVVARTGSHGQLLDARGHKLGAAQLDAYRSQDRPWSAGG